MSQTPQDGSAADAARDVRPLPARPNLEDERKAAKALLRLLRQGEPNALRRVEASRTPTRGSSDSREFRLADAQLAIAREYGFSSWPKLVSYYEASSRQERSGPSIPPLTKGYDTWPDRILAAHREQQLWVGQALAAFVPRLYGKKVADVLDSPITLDEARLVVARRHRFPSWEAFVTRMRATPQRRFGPWETQTSPLNLAFPMIVRGDIDRLAQHAAAHPELLGPAAFDEGGDGLKLLHAALSSEDRDVSAIFEEASIALTAKDIDLPDVRPVTDWILSHDESKHALDRMLLGSSRDTVADVERLLRRGANPQWIPPNGITVIEHAIARYHNGAAVDRIALEVTPPRAFWIAAGLGDVASVAAYFGRGGRLSKAARLRRPDFTAIGPIARPTFPDADDVDVVWEAFYVAGINQRAAALDLLLDRGFPIDYPGWGGGTFLAIAVGHEDAALTEYLVRHGADPDADVARLGQTPRAFARTRYAMEEAAFSRGTARDGAAGAGATAVQRIFELLGGDGRSAPAKPAAAERAIADSDLVRRIVTAATQDAAQHGQKFTEPLNLLVGVLRHAPRMVLAMLGPIGVDLARLWSAIEQPSPSGGDGAALGEAPLSPAADSLVAETLRGAEDGGHLGDVSMHMVHLLTRNATSDVVRFLGDVSLTTMVHEFTEFAFGGTDDAGRE